jgi:hypothetical protein
MILKAIGEGESESGQKGEIRESESQPGLDATGF